MFFGFHCAASVWSEYYPNIPDPTLYSNQHTQVSNNGNIFVTESSFTGISQAIKIEYGNLLVTDSQFNACQASSGGGIYTTATSAIFVRLSSTDCTCSSQGAFIYSSTSNCLVTDNSIYRCHGTGFNGLYITNGKQNLTTTNFSNAYSLINSAFCLTQSTVSFGNITYCTIAYCSGNPRISLIGYVEYRLRCIIYLGNQDSNSILYEMSKAYFRLENSILVNNSASYFANCNDGIGGIIDNCYYCNPSISSIGCIMSQMLQETSFESMSIKCPTEIVKSKPIISNSMNQDRDSFLKILVLSFLSGNDNVLEDKSSSSYIFLS